MVDFNLPGEARAVPRNLEAERSVLGSLLLDAQTVGDVSQILRADDFYLPAHQRIYEALISVCDKKGHADVIAIEEELKKRGHLDESGGRDTLIDLAGSVFSSAGITFHAEIVREKAIQRRLLETCVEVQQLAYDSRLEAKQLLDLAEQKIFEIARLDVFGDAVAIASIMNDTFERIDKLRERQGRLTGVTSGFQDLDDLTAGLQPGELLVLAARPSMGKTTFALNIVERAASGDRSAGIAPASVALFSLEMSSQQIIQNMLCGKAQIDGQMLRKGRITQEQYARLQQEAAALYESPIFIDDTPGISVTSLRAKARRLKQKHDISMIVIDYLQLMTAGVREESRQQEIATISRSLKALARELKVPVVALAELNRDVEARDDHRPRMSDLRESGAIEQDADVIMLLHREEYYKPTEENRGIAEIIIAKQRNGPTGTVKLLFFKNFMRFESYTGRTEPMG